MTGKNIAGRTVNGPPPKEIDGFDSLAGLALDMRSSWNHATDVIWRRLDPNLWENTHNPWDAVEADALYELLERHVVPEFYTREDSGIPLAWVKRMRESMARLTPRFSANRAVREYTERHYLPAALAFSARTTGKGELGKQMIDWRRNLDRKWSAVHFGVMKIETADGKHVFEIQLYLNNLDPTMARVELYAEGVMGGAPVKQEMKVIVRPADGDTGAHIYAAMVSAIRPKEDYTARVTPHFESVMVPLEESRIVWQR